MGTLAQNIYKYTLHIYLRHKYLVFSLLVAAAVLASAVLLFLFPREFGISGVTNAETNTEHNILNQTIEMQNTSANERPFFPETDKLSNQFENDGNSTSFSENLVNRTKTTPNVMYPEHLQTILEGITKIEGLSAVTPGLLTVFGKNAFPVLSGGYKSTVHPIIGAGLYNKGKFVAYSHTDCLVAATKSQFDNEKLLGNLALWVSAKRHNLTAGIHVYPVDEEKFQRIFTDHQIMFEIFPDTNNIFTNLTSLKKYDFLLLNNYKQIKDPEIEVVKQYVASGGGIIIGATPFIVQSFEIPKGSCFQNSFWGNRILNALGGVSYVEGNYVQAYETSVGEFNTSQLYLENTHADLVWTDMKYALQNQQTLNRQTIQQMMSILQDKIISAPKDIHFLQEIVDNIVLLLTPHSDRDQFLGNTTITPENIWQNVKQAFRQHKRIDKNKILEVKQLLHEQTELISPCSNAIDFFGIISEFGKLIQKNVLR